MELRDIVVTGAYLAIPVGVTLRLSDAQAVARWHALRPTAESGVYETAAPTGFKKGETFGTDLQATKALAPFFQVVAPEAPAALPEGGALEPEGAGAETIKPSGEPEAPANETAAAGEPGAAAKETALAAGDPPARGGRSRTRIEQ